MAKLSLLAALALATLAHSSVLVLSPHNTYGTWEGCGVSLAWWANVMGTSTSLADLAFNLSAQPVPITLAGQGQVLLPSLGFNIARYNAGATSLKPSQGRRIHLSSAMPAWKGIPLAWTDEAVPDPSQWDWGADANQTAMLVAAAARGASQLELFSNSPPWWQLANSNPSGADTGADDNLLPSQQKNFAYYLAQVAKHARDALGVSFTTVEAFNEPASTWWRATGTQEGCHFATPTQESVLALLSQQLAAAGLAGATRPAASDDNQVDEALKTWQTFSPATRALVGQVNVHGYEEGGDRAGLYSAVVLASHTALRDSEYGDGDGTGRTMAASLMADWAALHPNGWTYWQLLDEADGWGALRFSADQRALLGVNTKHYVLAQFSRHLRPGMTALGVSNEGSSSSAGAAPPAAAAWSPSTGVLALVLLNTGSASGSGLQVSLNLTAFGAVPDASSTAQWVTAVGSGTPTPGAAYTPVAGGAVRGGWLNVTVPAESVLTVEVQGVKAAAA
jgi:hypothetical protein